MLEITTEVDVVDGKPYLRAVGRIDGKMVHVDEFNPANASRRRRAAQQFAEVAGDTSKAPEIERKFLAALDEAMKSAPPDAVDVSKIVRPDLLITPQVVGLSVAQSVIIEGTPAGKWMLHLLWADGRREVRDLPNSLDLPDGSKLWIHPVPADPTASTLPGWSSRGRKAWEFGADAPDPARVFRRLCEAFTRFIELPDVESPGAIATLALWTMLSYVYPAWDAVPYIYVGGPLGSGKTRVFEVLARLVYRPVGSSNLTAAYLFRTLHDRGGSLLLDEAERLKESTSDAGEIRSILLAGYKRGGKATRLEPSGDTFKPVEFDCYGPKAIACITGLPPALASRCITVTMFRAAPGSEKPKRRVDADPKLWADLRDDLHALMLGPMGQAATELSQRTGVCKFSGRNFELWQPLMALASWLEERGERGVVDMVQAHAARATESATDDTTPDVDETLLRLLTEAVQDFEVPTAGHILMKAQQSEPDVFRRWTARTVAVHLKRYGLHSIKSNGVRSFRHITLDDLRRVQRHYGIDLGIGGENDGAAPSDPTAPTGPDSLPAA